MILEVAILNIKKGKWEEFEQAFFGAQTIISSIQGYVSHQLQKCLEKENRYILLVEWESLKSHTINFRESEQYKIWKKSLHHFYEPFPEAEHYQIVFSGVKDKEN